MSTLARLCFGASLAGLLAASRPAFAGDPAAAQALFDDAKKLVAAGKWADACPKLEESQRLDPGIGTEFHLATCHEQIGRSATAWAEFLDVAATAKTAGQGAREKAAREKAAALEPGLSRMKVSVTEDVPGLVVVRSGGDVGRGQWGVPVPLDPGPYTLTARAPGKKPWERTVRLLADGRTIDVAVPPLGDEAALPSAVDVVAPVPPATAAPPDAPMIAPADRGQGARIAGATLVIVGVAGIAVGTGFGIVSKGKHDDAQSHCDAANRCDAAGLGLRDDAIRNGTISTIAFAAGGAALITGAILWLTAPSNARSRGGLRAAPTVGANTMGLNLRGEW
jgi:hypothetical protein